MSEPAETGPSGATRAFRLRVLGPFELSSIRSGETIPLTTVKMRAMLAYLAASPRGSEDRRRLAGLLWASRGEDQARQSMRQMLSNIRRGPCAEMLRIDDSRVGIDLSRVEIDCLAAGEPAPSAGCDALCRIADLYRGEFAAGLDVGESEFDVWLQAERLKHRESAITLFDRLTRSLAESGRHEEALRRANRLLEFEPLREETHRLVIAQETIVSGRASAMQRFEQFRVLLRDELGVRPEAATMRLLDDLRRADARQPPPSEPAPVDAEPHPPLPALPPVVRAGRRALPISAALLLVALFGAMATLLFQYRSTATSAYIDDETGWASIVILPFEPDASDDGLRREARRFETEAHLAFARQYRMTLIEAPGGAAGRDAAAIGRGVHARYAVRTRLSRTADGVKADVVLLDSASGASLATAPMPMTDPPFKFARQMFRYLFPEIALHRAKTLASRDPDSIAALSWRGAAAQVHTRVGSADPDAFDLFDRVLVRDPTNFEAMMALIGGLQLRISREQSADRAADLDRSEALLRKARQLRPNLAEVSFLEGMDRMLRRQYIDAAPYFDRALQLDGAHWLAALKSAQIRMFLGRPQEADQQMEAVMPNLLPDIGAPESAYIAGEIALSADQIDRAVYFLDIAVRGNPTVARIQALYAAALWMAGRIAQAHAAAEASQKLDPPFPSERLALRGGNDADPRYLEARTRQVAALRAAISAVTADVSPSSLSER